MNHTDIVTAKDDYHCSLTMSMGHG